MTASQAPHPGNWPRLSALLDHALCLEPADLAPWLAALHTQEPAVAAELDALLRARPALESAGFLQGQALPAEPGLAGLRLGDWLLESPLGGGGMGTVWLARRADQRYSGRAAIKLLNLALVGQVGERRFRHEGTILATLNHPHIAQLLDAGVSAAGQPYLVLEYVQGSSITQYCDTRGLDLRARITLFLDVLAAVAHAHARLVVHRDIKPSNVWVTDAGVVKLLDFGIGKLMDAGGGDEGATLAGAALTAEAGSAMTPAFAAPEQLLGEAVSTGTDVYGLGLLLHLLLVGQHPHGDEALSVAQRLKLALEGTPVLPSVQVQRLAKTTGSAEDAGDAEQAEHPAQGEDPAHTALSAAERRATTPDKLARLLQGDLDNIVARALKRDAAQRYPSASAFADDLRRHLQHLPVQARPDSWAYRARLFVRRNRTGVALGTLTAAAFGAGVLGTLTQAQRASQQAVRAEQQSLLAQRERDHAITELSYAEAANAFMSFVLSTAADKPLNNLELIARTQAQVAEQFGGSAAIRARLQDIVGTAFSLSSASTQALASFDQARHSALVAKDPVLAATVQCRQASVHSDAGRYDMAAQLLNQSLTELKAAGVAGTEKPAEAAAEAQAVCRGAAAENEGLRGNPQAAIAHATQALQWLGTPRPGQLTLAADLHSTLATSYSRTGQLKLAVDEFGRARQLMRQTGRERTSQSSIQLNNMADVLYRAGQFLQARQHFQASEDIGKALAGQDGHNPLIEANLANALFENGHVADARAHFERAHANSQARQLEFYGAHIQQLGAPTLCAAGELQRCAAWLASGRARLGKLLPAGHHTFAHITLGRARLALAQGDSGAAHTLLLQAVHEFDAAKERRPARIHALALLARLEAEQGLAEAQAHADDAVAQARSAASGFEHSAWLGIALLARAQVQQRLSPGTAAAAESRASLREALQQLEATVDTQAGVLQQARALAAQVEKTP